MIESNYKGVTWDNKRNKWKVTLSIFGTKKHIGYFKDIEEGYYTKEAYKECFILSKNTYPVCKVCNESILPGLTGCRRKVFCSRKCYTYNKQNDIEYKKKKSEYDKEYRFRLSHNIKRKAKLYNDSDIGQYKTKLRLIKKI